MFYFRLCLALGYAHPDQLFEFLTSKQLAEWEAYELVEPFGSPRNDFMFGTLVSNLININTSKGSKKYKPEDIFPDRSKILLRTVPKEKAPQSKKQSWQDMKSIMMGMVKKNG